MERVNIFFSSLSVLWEKFWSFLGVAIVAIALLILGFTLARVAKSFMSKFLQLVKFDSLAERSGLESFLKAGEYPVTLSGIIGSLVYWIIMLMTIVAVADILGLSIISELFKRVVLYLPNAIIAVIILVLGMIFSRIVNRFMFSALTNFKVKALGVSTLCEYIVQVFVWFIALEQLQVNTDLLLAAFSIAFGALSLAAAIAFGLGGRDLARQIIDKVVKKIDLDK